MPTFKNLSKTEELEDVLKFTTLLFAAVPDFKLLHHVKIDYVFAYCDRDDDGAPKNFAITSRGRRVLGQTRSLNLKDRAKGNGDVEILLDYDWWDGATEPEKKALLDHELSHVQVLVNNAGDIKTDDLHRPKIKMRKHDVEVGWFAATAKRHGPHSQEQIQAKLILDDFGQFLFPGLVGPDDVQHAPARLTGGKR